MVYNDRLVIYDVSWILHYGETMKDPFFMNANFMRVNTSGLKYFLHKLAIEYKQGSNLIFCFDPASPIVRNQTGYKSNRKFHPHIYTQAEILYNYLSRAGHCCLRYEGIEADTLAYNAVENFKSQVKETFLVTNDGDWAHNVRHNVFQFTVSAEGYNITPHNYEQLIFPKEGIQYNTVNAYHVLVRDLSDNITGYSILEGKYSGRQLYKIYKEYLAGFGDAINYHGDYGKNPDTLRYFIKHYTSEEEDLAELERRIDLVFPKYYDLEMNPINFTEESFRQEYQLGKLLSIAGTKKLESKLKITKVSLDDDDIAEIKDLRNISKSYSNQAVDTIITESNAHSPIENEGLLLRVFHKK